MLLRGQRKPEIGLLARRLRPVRVALPAATVLCRADGFLPCGRGRAGGGFALEEGCAAPQVRHLARWGVACGIIHPHGNHHHEITGRGRCLRGHPAAGVRAAGRHRGGDRCGARRGGQPARSGGARPAGGERAHRARGPRAPLPGHRHGVGEPGDRPRRARGRRRVRRRGRRGRPRLRRGAPAQVGGARRHPRPREHRRQHARVLRHPPGG